MTVATQSNLVSYNGDNVAVTFPFTFPVYDAAHLFVYSQDKITLVQTLVTGYSVSGIGNENGGSVTLLAPPFSTTRLLITRRLPLTQSLDVENQGGFYPENFEVQLDLLEMQIQQLAEKQNRCIAGPLGETFAELPPSVDRAGFFLAFDDVTGLPIVRPVDQQDSWLLENGSGTGGGGGGATVSDEDIRDVIGAALVEGALVDITVNDGADTITIAVDTATLDERVRDTIGATLVEGVGIDLAVDDAGNSITISTVSSILSVVSAATVTPTFAYDQVNITAQAVGLTLANPTGTAVDGHGILIRVKDNGTSRAIAYGAKYRVFNDALPAATVVNKTLYIGIVYNAADDTWDVLGVRAQA